MPRTPVLRHWCGTAGVAGALALMPASMRAQFPIPELSHSYTYVGCSSTLPAVLGPGARVCATVGLTIGPDYVDPANSPRWWLGTMTVSTAFPAPYRWADCGYTNCGPVVVGGVLPGNGINDDAFHAPDCNMYWACAPGSVSYGTFAFRVDPGFIPTRDGSFAAYLYDPAEISPGDQVWDPAFERPLPGIDTYFVGFALTSIPEPATVALLAGGLALLGAAARRRRST